MAGRSLAEQLLDALPQTQCTRCGYPDCAGYATAMALGQAAINQCPPGGAQGVARLAGLTGLPALPLNPDNGTEGPRCVAFVDEAWCIGCTLCTKVCPTDAILGSNKLMHTVLEAYCTGCELCLPVCPVDCIVLENVTGSRSGWAAWSQQQADGARARYALRVAADRRPSAEVAAQPPEREAPASVVATPTGAAELKRRVIEQALERARRSKAQPRPQDT